MKKTRHSVFFSLLTLILFLSIGQVSLLTDKEVKEVNALASGEVQTDHHLNYGMPNSGHTMILAEGNYQLPTVNELKSHLNLFFSNTISCLSLLKEMELMTLKRVAQIIASLDTLTIIYPFHTFL